MSLTNVPEKVLPSQNGGSIGALVYRNGAAPSSHPVSSKLVSRHAVTGNEASLVPRWKRQVVSLGKSNEVPGAAWPTDGWIRIPGTIIPRPRNNTPSRLGKRDITIEDTTIFPSVRPPLNRSAGLRTGLVARARLVATTG